MPETKMKEYKMSHLLGAFAIGVTIAAAIVFAPGFGLQGFIGAQSDDLEYANTQEFIEFCSYHYTTGFAHLTGAWNTYSQWHQNTNWHPDTGWDGYTGWEYENGKGLVNRAQLAKLVVEAAGIEVVQTNNQTFADVPVEAWFHPYVETAYKYGFMQGYDNGNFDPSRNVNRIEVLKVAEGAFELESCSYDRPVFLDVNMWDWYSNIASTAVHWNVMSEGTNWELPAYLDPAGPASRDWINVALKNAKYPSIGDPEGYVCTEDEEYDACTSFGVAALDIIELFESGNLGSEYLTYVDTVYWLGVDNDCGSLYDQMQDVYDDLATSK